MRARRLPLALSLGLLTMASAALAQSVSQAPPPPDARVFAMMERISAERIAGHVRQLAAFGTRHTASDTQSDTRGIGAARR